MRRSRIEQRPMLQVRGITTRQLAMRLGMSYCGSTLYKHGVSRMRMARLAAATGDARLGDLAVSDVRWDRIVSVEPAGEVEVFGAYASGALSFFANDVITQAATRERTVR